MREVKKENCAIKKSRQTQRFLILSFFSSIGYEYDKDEEIIHENLTLKRLNLKSNGRMKNNYDIYLFLKIII